MPGPTRRAIGWMAKYGPFVVPVVACAAVFALMRPDAPMARAEVPSGIKWLFYDECDVAAYALRGANASVGRLPGRRDEPSWQEPHELAAALDGKPSTPAPRYYLEYPTPTLLLFRLGYVLNPNALPTEFPAAVADAHHYAVAFFPPRTAAERTLWGTFRSAYRVYYAAMTAALIVLVWLLFRGYEPGQVGSPVWLCMLPGALFFSLNRFDVLPALASAMTFYCLGRQRTAVAGIALSIGALIKVYPILFLPIILRHLGVRKAIPFLLGFVGTSAAGFGWCVWATDWEGTVNPILVQLSRPLEETSWTLYDRLLPNWLARQGEVRLGILGLIMLMLVWTRPADINAVFRRCGLILLPFMALAVFWSPQWLVWLLPIVVPLARNRPWLICLAVMNDLLNYFTFPILFWLLWSQFDRPNAMAITEATIFLRAAIWIGLAVQFLRADGQNPTAEFSRDLTRRIAEFLAAAPARGLKLLAATPSGEVVFVRDATSSRPVALLPLTAEVEPAEGSGLEDVAAARIPRPVTAVFEWTNGRWQPTGRALFNLGPAEVVARSGGRYLPLNPPPA